MARKLAFVISIGLVGLVPVLTTAQISFTPAAYYVAMGDSFASGLGALPATGGYAYRLYQEGVFGRLQETRFATVAVPGGRTFDVRDHQVPEVLCAERRPTVVTMTVGANDFIRGDQNLPAIAARVAEAVNLLLNNDSGIVAVPVLDPFSGLPCPAIPNVTIMVSNYPSMPHPDPAIAGLLDSVLRAHHQLLVQALSTIQVPAGSRVAYVDVFTPSLGRTGLTMLERRGGVVGPGPFDFDPHPTNLGHRFIAGEFERVWNLLQ
jgi:hypothetical protein